MKPDDTKLKLHPRNKHRKRYDFDLLIPTNKALAQYVRVNEYGDASIDFSNPQAVKALNQALLKQFYDIPVWDIPNQYLCPPIPGRADYLHYLADLLNETHAGKMPFGENVRVLDIGVGANIIYPLIGSCEYAWHFVGSDIEPIALQNAQQIIDANCLSNVITLRLQTSASCIFKGVIRPDDAFALTMCNPPFHGSQQEALSGANRKWRGLNVKGLSKQDLSKPAKKSTVLNFGGQNAELYCKGGEEAFVNTMINESKQYAAQCLWFTTLVSKAANLPNIYRTLKNVNALKVKTIEMAQGNKQSRIVAWTFLNQSQQQAWITTHLI